MSILETIRDWVAACPGITDVQVDYLDRGRPGTGLYPTGIEELSRSRDILGAVTVKNRAGFLLRFSMERGADSAGWLLDLQAWIQAQDMQGLVPQIGSRTDRVLARKGKLTDADEFAGLYSAELIVEYTVE